LPGARHSQVAVYRDPGAHDLPERGPPGPLMIMMRTWRSALRMRRAPGSRLTWNHSTAERPC